MSFKDCKISFRHADPNKPNAKVSGRFRLPSREHWPLEFVTAFGLLPKPSFQVFYTPAGLTAVLGSEGNPYEVKSNSARLPGDVIHSLLKTEQPCDDSTIKHKFVGNTIVMDLPVERPKPVGTHLTKPTTSIVAGSIADAMKPGGCNRPTKLNEIPVAKAPEPVLTNWEKIAAKFSEGPEVGVKALHDSLMDWMTRT